MIERLRKDHGDKPVSLLDAKGIRYIVAPYADRPTSRNQMLKMLRALLDLAVEDEDRADNPSIGIKRLKSKGTGFRTWQEDDIRQFLSAHGVGSKPYIAIALSLYTGQRRSDLVRLGWSMVRAGRLQFRQSKTGQEMDIPIAPRLMAILDAYCPKDDPTFLVTEWGKSFSAKGFGNWFRAAADVADLPLGFNSHGLRKAVCRRLAEAGCTTHEIMAISGHKSLAEVERYTSAANRRRLADSAMVHFGVEPSAPTNFDDMVARKLALPEPENTEALNLCNSGALALPTEFAGDDADRKPENPETPKAENSQGLSYWSNKILALPRGLALANDNLAGSATSQSACFPKPPVSPRRRPAV